MMTSADLRERTPTAPGRASAVRRHDLDWLRIMAVLLLIPFHSARVFDVFDAFYVKNGARSGGLSWGVIAFLDPWQMPLLFVLAGAATWLALARRSAGGYVAERAKRLLIPFLFGLLVIVPPQAYLARAFRGRGFSLADYWGFRGEVGDYTGAWTMGHLWFIAYLFVFSLIALPLLVRWRRRPVGARWLLFAMPILLMIANDLPAPKDGPQNPWYSLLLFVGGFLLFADPRAQLLIHRAWKPLLVVAATSMTTVLLVWHSGADATWVDNSLPDVGFSFLEQVNVWIWVLALLAAGHALLDRENRVLRYANEGAYPFYLLHQTVILAVAYVVVRWDLGVWPKYAVVVAVSFMLTLGLYEIAVRRWDATRFLFGMKPRRLALEPTAARSVEAEEARPDLVKV
jgi:peptidoglycan/LPS O-acetylase OafA/YrhL